MSAAARPEDQQAFGGEVSRTAEDDRVCLEEFLDRLDSTPSRSRHVAVWTGEKLGRLKLNGRVLRPSPLSAVTELEGCRLLLESNRALWSGLGHLAIGPADAAERARRAERLLATAERLRLHAVERATHQRVEPAGKGRDDPP
jgi:UDP-glucose 4-epimerase